MKLDGRPATDLSVPDDLESSQTKLVYLYLAVRESATADELCATLGVDKGSVLSITGTLRDRGYVERVDGAYGLA